MALLVAHKVQRSFVVEGREIVALAEQSLMVEPGDFLVLTGVSGSGKSTLLNLLSSLDRPSCGEVLYRGKSLGTMKPATLAETRNRFFGFIFQTPHLQSDRTVLENVAMPFRYTYMAEQQEIPRRCMEILEYVGMAEAAERFPQTLSGGEMQRVVFARAMVLRPEILFADEPTGSLDIANAERLLTLMQEQTKHGCSVVMASHDAKAITYGSRVIHLEKPCRVERC